MAADGKMAEMAYELAEKADNKANEAQKLAAIAVTQIAAHEKECGERWGVVVRLLYGALVVLVSILGTLMSERLN